MSTETETQTPPDFYLGTGRRKTSVARARLRPNGSGQITVNKRTFEEYFVREQDRIHVLTPLHHTNSLKRFDVHLSVHGGGVTGQAGACRLGISRALAKANEAYLQPLKDSGFLTRDSRKVERKKPGMKGARASFQFSKR